MEQTAGISIRTESEADQEAVHALLVAAFGGRDEASLVDDLRAGGDVVVALVACRGAEVVGHVLFSALSARIGGRRVPSVALAPLAVREQDRRHGIGARLVEEGLKRCRDAGYDLAVVLGDPAYYARFGFSCEAATRLTSVFSCPHLQALELRTGTLGDGHGTLVYAEPFGRFT